MERKVKFGVCADVHAATIPDGEKRIADFLEECRKENVDFVIELGDFCTPDYPDGKTDAIGNPIHPKRDKYVNLQNVVNLWMNFEKPAYHVLGNHEHDTCDKKAILEFYGEKNGAYYSFDKGGFHFVVLDNNYYLYNGEEYPYDTSNYYKDAKNKSLGYLPQEQLKWLKEDLAKTKNPSILFAHNWLHELPAYTHNETLKKNYDELMKIMMESPSGVYMCMYGHIHVDHIFRTNNIWQYSINSMSNCWIGTAFDVRERYSAEADEVFPALPRSVPWKDAVYAIVEMDEDGAMVTGTKSEFVGPSPEETGVYTHKKVAWNQRNFPVYITPEIISRYIKWVK